MDKKTIARNFSKYAHLYDRYADVQKIAAPELLGGIEQKGIKKILEIGCGTGNLTILLQEKFSRAELTALDISGKMIEIAGEKLKNNKLKFIVADGETVDLDEEFDLVASNACFQWFSDLGKALLVYRRLLKKKGAISFSTFGPLTFWELNEALREGLRREVAVSSKYFLEKGELEIILRRCFRKIELKELKFKELHFSLWGLLRKIKYSGTRGKGINNGFLWNRELLEKIERVYNRRFGRIEASYQIFICKGMK